MTFRGAPNGAVTRSLIVEQSDTALRAGDSSSAVSGSVRALEVVRTMSSSGVRRSGGGRTALL